MNNRLLAVGVALAVLVSACGAVDTGRSVPATTAPGDPITTLPDSGPSPTDPGTTLPDLGPTPGEPSTTHPNGIVGPVFIDSTEILYLESFPVQVRLLVRGSLPTPCHEAQWAVEDEGWAIDVELWSVVLLGQVCAQVLEPFEVSIPLGSYESATTLVLLNGEQIGRLAIGAEPPSDPVSLVAAGWSFGMCGGYCKADLVLAEGSLALTGSGWISDEPLFENRGTLTSAGRERIAAALTKLRGVALEPLYGCPDCADGGAAYLVLDRAGVASWYQMDFGRPPEILARLHDLALGMIDALETCVSDEVVTVADDCDPWQG